MVPSKNSYYFVEPKTPLANEGVRQIPGVEPYDESKYSAPSLEALKPLFEAKYSTQGTGGRNSKQPIDFLIHRRVGEYGEIKVLTRAQIESLLRGRLHLKPAYLRRGRRFIPG